MKILRSRLYELELKKREAEENAAKAAQTVILPVVLFILPAVVLIVAGPLILNFMANGGSM